MNLERTIDDQRFMNQIYSSVEAPDAGPLLPDRASRRIGQ